MYKIDLALNNLQWLICHKTKPNHSRILQNILLIFFGCLDNLNSASDFQFLQFLKTFRTIPIPPITQGITVSFMFQNFFYVFANLSASSSSRLAYSTNNFSLTISLYRPSLITSPLDGIQCPHSADECKFLKVCNLFPPYILLVLFVCEMVDKWSNDCYSRSDCFLGKSM